MGPVLVKICGHRTPDEAAASAEAGADAVGAVVDAPDSPRNLPHDAARDVLEAAPADVDGVAVTVARDEAPLEAILDDVTPDVLQLHDGAPPPVRATIQEAHPDVDVWVATDPDEGLPDGPYDAVLVDARTPDGYGGTGTTLDWDRARTLKETLHPTPLILAGGLTPGNVAEAVDAVDPAGVDVASGVEADGAKDPEAVEAFIAAARRQEASP